jgi:hypothetical protein
MRKLSINTMQIFSREELKKIRGGDDYGYGGESGGGGGCKTSTCTFTDAYGVTSSGTCGAKGEGNPPYGTITVECFCNTPSHTSPTPVGSNGGVSRCAN